YPRTMRSDRRLIGWGIIFLLLGAVPLSVQAGLVPRDAVAQAWRLWPLLLVGLGVTLVLRDSRLALIGSVIGAVTVGLIGGGLLGGGLDVAAFGCGGRW